MAFKGLWVASMLFVYGTLRDQDVLALVLGRVIDAQALAPAEAPGFRAVAYPGRVYPALVKAEGEAAPGLRVDGLDETDLARLDDFEGDEYQRRTLTILVDGRPHVAEAYLPTQPVSSAGPAWSLSVWTRKHKAASMAADAETLRQRLTGSQSRG